MFQCSIATVSLFESRNNHIIPAYVTGLNKCLKGKYFKNYKITWKYLALYLWCSWVRLFEHKENSFWHMFLRTGIIFVLPGDEELLHVFSFPVIWSNLVSISSCTMFYICLVNEWVRGLWNENYKQFYS